jgi:hypothetical protein
MFLLFALLNAMMPCFASMSRLSGSIPFWLMTTKFFFSPIWRPSLSSWASQTSFLSSMTLRTLASVNLRSDSTSFSRCSADE